MKASVLDIIELTWRDLWAHKGQWMRILFAPLMLMALGLLLLVLCMYHDKQDLYLAWVATKQYLDQSVVLHLQIAYLRTTYLIQNEPIAEMLLPLTVCIGYGLYCIASIHLMINSIRYALFQEGGKRWWTLHWNARFFKLASYVYLAKGAPLLYYSLGHIANIEPKWFALTDKFPLLPSLLSPIILVGMAYVLGRVLLFGLFIATDTPRPLRRSWATTKGMGWRMFALFLVNAIIAGLIPEIVKGIFWIMNAIGAQPLNASLVFSNLTMMLFSLISCMALSKAVALVYQNLEEEALPS